MKGFGVFVIVVGVLALAGGVALGFVPIAYDSPSGFIDCGGFVATAWAGGTLYTACLPVLLGYAWMIPTAGLLGVVLILIGALIVQSGRIRELRGTLAYARTTQAGAAATPGRTLSGNGVPVGTTSGGVTSSAQASYAAQAGYTNALPVPQAAPSYAVPTIPAPTGPAPHAFATMAPPAPEPAYASVQPQQAFPAPQSPVAPQTPPAPQQPQQQPSPHYSDMPVYAQPAYAPAGYAEAQPAPQYAEHSSHSDAVPGGFVQPGSGFVPQSGQPIPVY